MGSTPIGISASRGAAVLGLSKYKTRIQVWIDIMEARRPGFAAANGYKHEPFTGNDATDLGHLFEDSIIEQAERIADDKIVMREQLFQCAPEDYITCHIDGMYKKSGALHEGKTAQIFVYREEWGEVGTDAIPKDYAVQVQHQMACSGASHAIVSVLVLPMRQSDIVAACPLDDIDKAAWLTTLSQMGLYLQHPVERNDDAITGMLERYREFWADHVLREIPPEPVDYDDLRRVFADPVGTVIAGADQEMWSAEYKAFGEEQAEITRQKNELKFRLINWAKKEGEALGVVVDEDSGKKLIIKDRAGNRLHSFGKQFR